jgi:hypothetical protein
MTLRRAIWGVRTANTPCHYLPGATLPTGMALAQCLQINPLNHRGSS